MPGQEPDWDAYVSARAEATVFHLAGWKGVIERATGQAGHYLMAWEGARVVGIYPLFVVSSRLFGAQGVSLPFVSYGGIVADDAAAEQALGYEAWNAVRMLAMVMHLYVFGAYGQGTLLPGRGRGYHQTSYGRGHFQAA